jgi:CSLREA domain-containing protein
MYKFGRILVGILFILCLSQGIFAATYTITKIADTSDGTCDADCSLREAITAANATADNDVITFSALFNSPQTITLGGTDLIITNNGTLTINGTGAENLTVSGNNVSRVFTNNTGAVTTINSLRVTAGNAVSTVTTGRGGGIYNSGGNLTLNNLIINGNTAPNGGGTNNAGTATMTINNCVISNNTVTGGGGGSQNFAGNTLNVSNTTYSNNTANSTTSGGGAIQANGTVNVVNSTFSGNNAIAGNGGAFFFNGTVLNITNATISGNTSTQNGGGITKSNANPANIRNTIIAGNNGIATSPDATGTFNSLGTNIIGNVGVSAGWIASDLQNVNPMLGALANNGGFTNTFLPMPGSPAIDAGQNCVTDLSCATNNPATAITTDQRGVARPAGGTVDIGAVEVAAAVANVSVSGKVVSQSGSAIANVIVTISNMSGIVQTVRTNNFGNFTFTNIPSGQMYSLNVVSRNYSFTPQNVNVSGDVTGVVITANADTLLESKEK